VSLKLSETSNLITVQNGATEIEYQQGHRKVSELAIGDIGWASVIAYRRNDRTYEDLAGESRLTYLESKTENGAIVVEASYDGALKHLRWRIKPAGAQGLVADLDYEYSFEGLVDIVGVRFDADEKSIRSIRWLGMGPYRVWQNRLEGTRLDVWQNAYNDSTPGEKWIYPEFKGYFRDVRWAAFTTNRGSFMLSTDNSNSYLGLFKPSDGVNGLLDFPDVGIAVLDAIPAIRNKFHTTDEIGPQSKAKQVVGVVRRKIELRF
jgi:hypothetical protein